MAAKLKNKLTWSDSWLSYGFSKRKIAVTIQLTIKKWLLLYHQPQTHTHVQRHSRLKLDKVPTNRIIRGYTNCPLIWCFYFNLATVSVVCLPFFFLSILILLLLLSLTFLWVSAIFLNIEKSSTKYTASDDEMGKYTYYYITNESALDLWTS